MSKCTFQLCCNLLQYNLGRFCFDLSIASVEFTSGESAIAFLQDKCKELGKLSNKQIEDFFKRNITITYGSSLQSFHKIQ